MVPGTRALEFLAGWFDQSTVSAVFEPLIADWQREWQEAAGQGRLAIWMRGAGALLISTIAASPNVWFAPWPASTLRRVTTRVTLWTTIFTALNVAPFLNSLRGKVDIGVFPYLVIVLIPQAVAVAFPIAIATIVDLIRTAPEPNREERIAALRIAIASVALMSILCGWAFPAANQQFRVLTSRAVSSVAHNREPARGLRELSIVELFQDERLVRHSKSGDPIYDAWIASGAGAGPVLGEIGQRFSLTLLPIALLWMRWRALLLPRGRWYSALPLVVSAPFTVVLFYLLLLKANALSDMSFLPRWLGPMLALTFMIVGASMIDLIRQKAGLKTRLYTESTTP